MKEIIENNNGNRLSIENLYHPNPSSRCSMGVDVTVYPFTFDGDEKRTENGALLLGVWNHATNQGMEAILLKDDVAMLIDALNRLLPKIK